MIRLNILLAGISKELYDRVKKGQPLKENIKDLSATMIIPILLVILKYLNII